MKIVLGALILIACVLLSLLLVSKYTKRRVFYEEFSRFNNQFLREVEFAHNTILSIIQKWETDSDFIYLIKNYFLQQKLSFNLSYITDGEQKFILSYLQNVGVSDRDSQITYLKKIDYEIIERLNTCKSEEKTYKSLYLKVGFLLGLILFVIVL